jgi:hypothetical protein
MQKVASLSIHTVPILEVSIALLRLILPIVIEILPELAGAMRKLALIVVGTVPHSQPVTAEFVLEFDVVGAWVL